MDTNALMMPVECDVRVFEELDRLFDGAELDLVVPEAVLDELERLSGGEDGTAASEAATAASVALDLARERCRPVGHEAEYADDAVVECSRAAEVTHAVTNDGPLRDRLLARGVPVISLRGRNKLAVTQP